MRGRVFWFLLAAVGLSAERLAVDGRLDEAVWTGSPRTALEPVEAGVPRELGGEVRLIRRGAYLLVGARLPEPGGRVLARSIGRNPVWEKDALESPELEDRLRLETGGRVIEINPWGGYRAPDDLPVVAKARIDSSGWTVESAIVARGLGEGVVKVSRIRSRRALAPEFRWKADIMPVAVAGAVEPSQTPFAEPTVSVGRLNGNWSGVPAFELLRNEPEARRPRYPAKVRWAHDSETLTLEFDVTEPEPVVARGGGRDANIAGDDHVGIYLATTGSSYLEILVNSVGAIRDSRGMGPRITRPNSGWDGKIVARTEIRHGGWTAHIEIPLEECARALGESALPHEWRVAVVRHRAARPGEAAEWSALPASGAATTFYGPARYRRMALADEAPGAVVDGAAPHYSGLAAKLAEMDSNVWTPLERRRLGARSMTGRYLDRKVREAVLRERQAWEKVRSREEWERFRDERIRGLRDSMGRFPPNRPPLDVQVSGRYNGRGYRQENIAFQSRAAYWMSANVYTPEKAGGRLPAIVIVHSQHYPKTQGELHDMGQLWARAGALVMIMERPGYGERAETNPWFRQAYGSRDNFTKLLFLAGESYSGWAAWDIIRSVDYLYEREDVDRSRIILLGSVAGGGEPSAVAAALDQRITVVAPYNYDQGHVRVHGDSPGQISQQFSPWLVAASIAPRRMIRAFEFGWEGAEEPDYPELWVDGMERSQRVWKWYNASDRLATAQGFGLIRLSMERASHCFSIGPEQRESLYPILERWFGIPYPSAEDRAMLPDSGLTVNRVREEARRQEATRRRPHAELVSITPLVNARIKRRALHELAGEIADAATRIRSREELLRRLPKVLGDIEPNRSPAVELKWSKVVEGVMAEALVVAVEDGIRAPVLLLRPVGNRPAPVVVAVAQGGKTRFLSSRAAEIEALLKAGIAVALADVRGTGETAAGFNATPTGLAQTEFDLGGSLLGSRVKDLRTVLAALRGRADLDRGRIALWGESFSPSNENLYVDEVEFEGAPNVQHRSDPMGAHVALLTGLFEGPEVTAIVGTGGLASYRGVLSNAVTYAPMDVIVHGILRVTDIPEMVAAIGSARVRWMNAVDGRNVARGRQTTRGDTVAALIRAFGK